MKDVERKNVIIQKLIEELELPEGAYEKAISRYEDLGKWFSRNESSVKEYNPHIFSQGSFRLGTAIRPLTGKDEYDLDLACKLRSGISKETHSQSEFKSLIGKELVIYRELRRIEKALQKKHRCWRLEYQDDLSFHMDIVPCIPESESKRKVLFDSLTKDNIERQFAQSISDMTVSITDDRSPDYKTISSEWNISNPEGYALWFENSMKMEQKYNLSGKATSINRIPLFKRKSPLQKVIQLLKRHRDIMFNNHNDSKPISIIITTLAAMAYNGEIELYDALLNILTKMNSFVNSVSPRVPNPVNPKEDFADRWEIEKYRHLKLEESFFLWVKQVETDLDLLSDSLDPVYISKQAFAKFGIHLDKSDLTKSLGIRGDSIIKPTSRIHEVSGRLNKPWGRD